MISRSKRIFVFGFFICLTTYFVNIVIFDHYNNDNNTGGLLQTVSMRRNVRTAGKGLKYAKLRRGIDMTGLRKQRLKPWEAFVILGGDLCPGSASIQSPQVSTLLFGAAKYIEWKREIENGERANECPFFMECGGALSDVSYCFVAELSELRPVAIRLPRMLNDTVWKRISHLRSTLPWEGQLVSVRNGAYVNALGQVFTERVQYYHGGCQDIVDSQHGGERQYGQETKVLMLGNALNLVHAYGDNYFHFLIEVLPRFFLAKSLLNVNADLSVIIHSTKHLDMLRLIGIEREYLNLHLLDGENELIYATDNLMFPLAPRCLHAPKELWRLIREEMIKQMPVYILELPQDFTLYRIGEFQKKYPRTVNIIYYSRLNKSPRRHLAQEDEFLSKIVETFQLTCDGNRWWCSSINSDPSSNLNIRNVSISFKRLFGNESLVNTVRYVSEATIIMGPHGAALSNMIFAPEGATLLEFAPTGYWNPCFMHLSNALNLNYYMIRAEHGSQNQNLYLGEEFSFDKVVSWIRDQIFRISFSRKKYL